MNRRRIILWSTAIMMGTVVRAVADDGARESPALGKPNGKISQTLRLISGRDESNNPGSQDSPAPAVEKRITLQTASTDIGSALRLVAEQGGLNLVVGPQVEGEVSVYLEDVPVQTALRAIAVNNGFAFTVEDGVITVSKPPERGDGEEQAPPVFTRIFTLQWQDAERVRDALEYALSQYGRIKVLNENSRNGYGVQRLSSLGGDVDGVSGSVSQTATASYQGDNKTAGPGSPSSNVDQPQNARTLVVTDVKENLAHIADLIADLDRLPPQVLIEARIVEMSTDLQRELGIDWNVDVLASGPVLNHEWPLNNRAGFAAGTDRLGWGPQIRYSPNGTPHTANGLALGTIDFTGFTALLRAHQTDNAIRLLANPRMLVHNNHSASILVGERYPILQATITDYGTVTEAFDTYIPVGVQLEVTPTIMMDGRVSLLVHPATSALGDDVVGTTGLRVARIRTREMDTRAIMRDGQTIVLGGLISDRKTRSAEKVPGLGDWPIFSIFFRQENPRSERVDLLIFLTVHVEGATKISERDQSVFDAYRPHFKHVEHLQDVPLHFEIPTEYEPPKPMFGDPPVDELTDVDEETYDSTEARGKDAVANQRLRIEDTQKPSQNTLSPSQSSRGVAAQAGSANGHEAGSGQARLQGSGPKFKPAARDLRQMKRMKHRRAGEFEATSTAKSEEGP